MKKYKGKRHFIGYYYQLPVLFDKSSFKVAKESELVNNQQSFSSITRNEGEKLGQPDHQEEVDNEIHEEVDDIEPDNVIAELEAITAPQ